jgi:hypothetical protein
MVMLSILQDLAYPLIKQTKIIQLINENHTKIITKLLSGIHRIPDYLHHSHVSDIARLHHRSHKASTPGADLLVASRVHMHQGGKKFNANTLAFH